LDIDIDAVFSDKRAAASDVHRELSRATAVSILASRGNELQRDTFDPLFMNRPAGKAIQVRILLPETTVGERNYDWTAQREAELARFDPAFGHGLLREQIETTVAFLQRYFAGGHVELARFNYPHVGRIVITDRCAFYTPYRKDSHGRDSVIFKYRRGEMYDNLSRLFEQLWDAAQPRT
jgi:hypothetical protein